MPARGDRDRKDTEVREGSHFQATKRPVWKDQMRERMGTHLEKLDGLSWVTYRRLPSFPFQRPFDI